MIIVDDCSTDRTVEIIQEFQRKDSRIHLIQLKHNSGTAVARNTAIENAKGRFIAFLDSDDLWLPTKLEEQIKFMMEKDIAFSFTEYQKIKEDGTETDSVVRIPFSVTYTDLLKHCVIGCLTVMLDKEKVDEIRMVNIRSRQDYVLWLSLARNGIIPHGLQKVLAKYRLRGNSVSSNKFKAAKNQWKVYRKIEQLNMLKSTWYFLHYMWFATNKYFK
jgi:teichuronic acid biosynthesis glycosyltransferase TuaG